MKTILIYESTHHGNTKKLVDAVAERYGIRTATVEEAAAMDLTAYDRIGIASGVAFGKFYEATERFVDDSLPKGKEVFFLERPFFHYAAARGCKVLGVYGCRGFDTFGPFKLIGGIAKGHPTQNEIDGAVDFYGSLAD